jgi:hypothetical protein
MRSLCFAAATVDYAHWYPIGASGQVKALSASNARWFPPCQLSQFILPFQVSISMPLPVSSNRSSSRSLTNVFIKPLSLLYWSNSDRSCHRLIQVFAQSGCNRMLFAVFLPCSVMASKIWISTDDWKPSWECYFSNFSLRLLWTPGPWQTPGNIGDREFLRFSGSSKQTFRFRCLNGQLVLAWNTERRRIHPLDGPGKGCGHAQKSSFPWISCGTDSRSKSRPWHEATFVSLEDFLYRSRFAGAAEYEPLSVSMVNDRGASDGISAQYGGYPRLGFAEIDRSHTVL